MVNTEVLVARGNEHCAAPWRVLRPRATLRASVAKVPPDERLPPGTGHRQEPHSAARDLSAAELVHDGGAVWRLLCDRTGDERPLRPVGHRHIRGHGSRW